MKRYRTDRKGWAERQEGRQEYNMKMQAGRKAGGDNFYDGVLI